jgi:DNA helicase II / ATP-dependent DNA helicase PcrA
MPTPTDEQQAIIEAVAVPDGSSIMIQAGAGCAKTTTAVMSMSGVRVPTLSVAFNKRNADELAKVMPQNVLSKTANGVCHGAWLRARNLRGAKVDAYKGSKLISEIAKQNHMHLSTDQWDYAKTLFREAQIQGLVPEPFGSQFTTLVPDTKEGWQALADQHAIPDEEFEYVWEVTRDALIENIKQAFQGIISFDDQIYCATLLGGVFQKYDFLVLDEVQDFNPLNIRMAKMSITKDGRIFAVGDKYQSIYAFRGAVGDAHERIRELRANWTDLPLMTSFRVPKLVAARQTDHVPGFRAHESNAPGQIVQVGSLGGWTWDTVTRVAPDWPIDTAILCRNNAPLITLAFKLIRNQIGCHVLGRDISKGLKALTKKLCPDDNTKADIVKGKIQEWLQSELAKARVNDNPDAADKFTDKAESIIAVLESAECQDAGQLRRQIDNLFNRENSLITLSTVHKAKGMEWPVVMHLDPQRVPSQRAINQGGRALEQELNLKYVAETRTKHTLLLAQAESYAL